MVKYIPLNDLVETEDSWYIAAIYKESNPTRLNLSDSTQKWSAQVINEYRGSPYFEIITIINIKLLYFLWCYWIYVQLLKLIILLRSHYYYLWIIFLPKNNRYLFSDDYALKKTKVELTESKIHPIRDIGFCTGFPGNPIMKKAQNVVNPQMFLVGVDVGGLRSESCGGVETSSIYVSSVRDWIDNNLSWYS